LLLIQANPRQDFGRSPLERYDFRRHDS
jgi:hypothetical protein